MHVAILYNQPLLPPEHADYASEAGVLEAVDAFERALRQAGHRVNRVGATASAVELVNTLAGLRPDVVVNLCEGFAGRSRGEPCVAGLLELLELPYTGCGPEALSLVRDKARTKWLLLGAGLPTAAFWKIDAITASSYEIADTAMQAALSHGPLFVKPAGEDASLGIGPDSVVSEWPSLLRQVREVSHRYGDVLVEQYVDGREFNVGVVGLPELTALPLAEIQFQLSESFPRPIVTYDSKWSEGTPDYTATPVQCPANVEPELAERIRQVALQAFRATGCRDYARVDLRVTHSGEIYVLEVNANPDAGPAAGLARALGVAGIDYAQFVLRLVEAAAGRQRNAEQPAKPVEKIQPPGTPSAPLILRQYSAADRAALLDVLRACQMFRDDEVEVAAEILDEVAKAGPAGHYKLLVAEQQGQPLGWSCHGLVPMTDATYDLYWIAVHPQCQAQGVGRKLLAAIEEQLQQAQGRWLIAETSSSPAYDKTRSFYLRTGFELVSDLADFYRPGDGRATYAKRLR